MQSVAGAVIGCLLGLLVSAGVLSLLCIAWYFTALLSLANWPLAKEISEFGAQHAVGVLATVVIVCCGGLSVLGFNRGMGVYTSADF